jgi:hypothetical protein
MVTVRLGVERETARSGDALTVAFRACIRYNGMISKQLGMKRVIAMFGCSISKIVRIWDKSSPKRKSVTELAVFPVVTLPPY